MQRRTTINPKVKVLLKQLMIWSHREESIRKELTEFDERKDGELNIKIMSAENDTRECVGLPRIGTV